MSDYQSFRNEWTGRRVDWDRVFGWQCVDLVLQYVYQVHEISGLVRGNAIDYWTNPSPALLTKFDKLETIDCHQGDIVVFRTAGRNDYAGDGHIGICDSQDTNSVRVLEQNGQGGGNGVGLDAIGIHRSIPKSRIAGVLRPKPVNTAPLWTVETIASKQVKIKPGMYKWNLGHANFTDVANNPIVKFDDGIVITANGILHHREIPQYNYYVEDVNTPHGFNVLDCDFYTPPVPYTPPAAPIPIPEVKRQNIEWGVPVYATAMDAKMKQNPLADKLAPGNYIVLKSDDKAYNLTADNRRDGQWVNIDEDKPPVPVTPVIPPKIVTTIQEASKNIPLDSDKWKASIASFNIDRSPEYFWATNASQIVIKDLEGKRADIEMTPYNCDKSGKPRRLPAVATLEKDGILYAWPEQAYKARIYYCVPMFVLTPDKGNVFDDTKDWIERVVTHTMRISDHPKLAWYRFNRWLDGIKQTEPGKDS